MSRFRFTCLVSTTALMLALPLLGCLGTLDLAWSEVGPQDEGSRFDSLSFTRDHPRAGDLVEAAGPLTAETETTGIGTGGSGNRHPPASRAGEDDPLYYTALAASTYIGTAMNETMGAPVLDDEGYLYTLGRTNSEDFPTSDDAYDDTFNGEWDLVIMKWLPDLSDYVYSTYLGGSRADYAIDMEIDGDGNLYLLVETYSEDYPTTPGAYDRTLAGGSGYQDLALTKLDPATSQIIFSTYVGGTGYEHGGRLVLDGAGNVCFTGSTSSAGNGDEGYPTTPGAYDRTFNGGWNDGFATVLAADGSTLLYSTLIGGNDGDIFYDIDVDRDDNLYITGYAISRDYPVTQDAYQPYRDNDNAADDNWDAVLSVFRPAGNGQEDLIYSTFFNGDQSRNDLGKALHVDEQGRVYLAGETNSEDFPTTAGCFDDRKEGYADIFVLKIDIHTSQLHFSTYFGAGGAERVFDLLLDDAGNLYLLGDTDDNQEDFPITEHAYDRTFNGRFDPFYARLDAQGSSLHFSTFIGGRQIDGGRMALGPGGEAYIAGYTESNNFPTTEGAYDEDYNGDWIDGFVLRMEGGLDEPPVARVDSIAPQPATLDDTVTLLSGATDDCGIARYQWHSDLDGELYNWTQPGFGTDHLSLGRHTLTHRVLDTRGQWSPNLQMELVVTERPWAHIQSITPARPSASDSVTLKARAQDDGQVVGYTWTSSLDGELYNDSEPEVTLPGLSPGQHTITLRVQDELGVTSAPVATTLTVDPMPVASIVSVSKPLALTSDTLILVGGGTGSGGGGGGGGDGGLAIYSWRSSLDGQLYAGAASTVEIDTLSVGTHTLYLRVQNEAGAWSQEASTTLTLTERPVVRIDRIAPRPAGPDDEITLTASATDDGTIATYIWTSSLEGELFNGSAAMATLAGLTQGEHRIQLMVQDDLGFWSRPVETSLVVSESLRPAGGHLPASDGADDDGSGEDLDTGVLGASLLISVLVILAGIGYLQHSVGRVERDGGPGARTAGLLDGAGSAAPEAEASWKPQTPTQVPHDPALVVEDESPPPPSNGHFDPTSGSVAPEPEPVDPVPKSIPKIVPETEVETGTEAVQEPDAPPGEEASMAPAASSASVSDSATSTATVQAPAPDTTPAATQASIPPSGLAPEGLLITCHLCGTALDLPSGCSSVICGACGGLLEVSG